ncbi:unnamed protein product [Periconia digitata]|uniref:Uncharacterized protein n=1 Tax=Periconia digitata TaxID=1303443 RepID=A0A9W4XQT2_9PLEO|nr:unnamed protein product [Periconia digitata]
MRCVVGNTFHVIAKIPADNHQRFKMCRLSITIRQVGRNISIQSTATCKPGIYLAVRQRSQTPGRTWADLFESLGGTRAIAVIHGKAMKLIAQLCIIAEAGTSSSGALLHVVRQSICFSMRIPEAGFHQVWRRASVPCIVLVIQAI